MRSWITDETVRQQLNSIVHSGDKDARNNPFKDITASYDESLDSILNLAGREYKDRLTSAMHISRVNAKNVVAEVQKPKQKTPPKYNKAEPKQKLGNLRARLTAAAEKRKKRSEEKKNS